MRALAVGAAVFTNGAFDMVLIADVGVGPPVAVPLAPLWALRLLGALLLHASLRRPVLALIAAALVLLPLPDRLPRHSFYPERTVACGRAEGPHTHDVCRRELG